MKNLIAKAFFVTALVLGVGFFATATTAEARSYDRYDRCERPTIDLNRADVRGDLDKKFSYRVVVRGDNSLSTRIEGLPRGLSYNNRTDVIEGYPEEVGTFNVTIVAENNCGRTYKDTVIRIRDNNRGAAGSVHDANVTLDSELIINPEGSGIYLTQIPYTGAGNVLQYTLTILAMLLWGGAVAVAVAGEKTQARLKDMFFRVFALERSVTDRSVIDRSFVVEDTTSNEEVFFVTDIENEEIEVDTEKLQEMRAVANEEKVIFSESMFAEIALKAESLEMQAVEFFSNLVEDIKAKFPRIDGYIKVDAERLAKFL